MSRSTVAPMIYAPAPAARARHATRLETLSVIVPEAAVEPYEHAIAAVCATVGMFEADDQQICWRIEGVRQPGQGDAELEAGLALAALVTGFEAELVRSETEADGWLARIYESFPEQQIGRRFAVRGTHLPRTTPREAGRLVLTLDAGIAFGSGEHGSTRGCLRAFERVAYRKPRRILDLGTGTGVLAMGAAALLHRRVLAVDIEPWSVRVTAENAELNGLGNLIEARHGNGWRTRAITRAAPFDLVFANILARPLCAMAGDLGRHLAPGGTAILAGLLASQANMVLAAHRRAGLVLEQRLREGDWATLILRKPA